MAKKQNNYINAELEWSESKLQEWRDYIDQNPLNTLKDRWGQKEMPRGGHTWVVTATIEQQVKSIRDTMKEYLQMLEIVDKLREKEEAKKLEARGKGEVTGQASDWLKDRNAK